MEFLPELYSHCRTRSNHVLIFLKPTAEIWKTWSLCLRVWRVLCKQDRMSTQLKCPSKRVWSGRWSELCLCPFTLAWSTMSKFTVWDSEDFIPSSHVSLQGQPAAYWHLPHISITNTRQAFVVFMRIQGCDNNINIIWIISLLPSASTSLESVPFYQAHSKNLRSSLGVIIVFTSLPHPNNFSWLWSDLRFRYHEFQQ